ncbi:MAG: SURF1 family protein [Pseudomonadota bacterium]
MSGPQRWIFLILIGLGGAGFLMSLGLWQVSRLAEKEALIATLRTRLAAVPLLVAGTETPEDFNYRRAKASGQYLFEEEPITFPASLKPHGPGERWIMPFALTTGETILVDRGFVPQLGEGVRPDGGLVVLVGVLHWPRETTSFTPEPNTALGRWFARDVESMARHFGTEPVMLVLDTPSGATDRDEFPKPIPVTVSIPNDHLGYAVTWFSLAAIWLAMTLFLMRRTARPSMSQKD